MRFIPVALAAVLLLGGCGDPTPTPADAVPVLATQLTAIDGLIAARHWGEARAALRELIAATERARVAGDLDQAEADRVIASATRVLAALPTPTPSVSPSPSPTPTAPQPGASHGDKPDGHKSDKGAGDKGRKGG